MHASATEPPVDRFGMAHYVELGPDGAVGGVGRAQATPAGVFGGSFTRKSDKNVDGTIAANAEAGLTKILVSLVYPA